MTRVDRPVQLRAHGERAGRAGAGGRGTADSRRILAAASIAGSVLGTTASHGSLDGWAVAALITFALCLASAVWVLPPISSWFAVRGETLLAETDHRGVQDVAQAYRAPGIWIEPNLDRNRDMLSRMSGWFAVSCGLLAAEGGRRCHECELV